MKKALLRLIAKLKIKSTKEVNKISFNAVLKDEYRHLSPYEILNAAEPMELYDWK